LVKKALIIIIIGFVLSTNITASAENIFTSQDSSYSNNPISPEKNYTINIAVTGDLLTTKNVQITAESLMNESITDPYIRVASGFESLFSESIIENISSADLAFGNLEEPIAEGLTEKWYWENNRPVCEKINVEPGDLYDDKAYKYNPRMVINAHPALALALKNVGFDIVSTANNHYANRASNGIDLTIDALNKAGLDFVGTLKYDEIIDENSDGYPENIPYIIKNVKGVKIAFLGFATQTNHIVGGFQIFPVFRGRLPPADKFCSRQIYSILSNNAPIEFNIQNFCNGIREAKNNSDIVCVSVHWGICNKHEPSILQKKIAKRFLESGADVIIGHGPHVVQPIEKVITSDNRETYVIYSLGNFLIDGAYQRSLTYNSKVAVIGFINIVNSSGNILINNITNIPTFSSKTEDKKTKVVIAENHGFKKAENIVQTVMDKGRLNRFILSQLYLSITPGLRIFIRDDIWPDHWILLKWSIEEIKNCIFS
jgi:poly-gamma-glutamate synthesis protein (capsule biosynthesis protein)